MRGRGILIAVVALAVACTGLLMPAASAVQVSEQEYFWKWSDGSQATHRTFSERRYLTQRRLPDLVVTAVPAKPRHYVYLQFMQGGKWVLENRVALNSRGIAHVDINPYCESHHWCDGTYRYRLKVVDQWANLTVTYQSK